MSATADRGAHARALSNSSGRTERQEFWRSLEDLADGRDIRSFVAAEFPALAERLPPRLDRRTLLKLFGATLSMAGLTACSEAKDIVPYVRQPENVIPGKPRYYATTLTSEGYGIGAIVESHEGRPTKIEGNPDHPASLGATDAVMQAAALELFDPERTRTVLFDGDPASYDDFLKEMSDLARALAASGGADAALLIEPSTSPSLKAQLEVLRRLYPKLRVYSHDPLATTGSAAASQALYGRALLPVYRVEKADVIVSLDADFLGEGPGRLAYGKAFADRRRVRGANDGMSRLYAIESTPTITGAAADHRKVVKPSAVEAVAAALHAAISGGVPEGAPIEANWLATVADDLKKAGPRALIVPGPHQSPFVNAAALSMNRHLGSLGATVELIETPDQMRLDGTLADFLTEISRATIDTAFVLGCNPVGTAPGDLKAHEILPKLKRLVHWGLYRDETAKLAHWHVPAAHDLESWSDIRAYDGTASIIQPLILPLFQGRTIHEILAALAGEFDKDALALVRRTWAGSLDDAAWRTTLRNGVVANSAAAPVTTDVPDDLGGLKPSGPRKGIEIRFVADPFLRDGRHANAPWLQELPRPLTKIVWGNALLLSPAMAGRLGIENNQVVDLVRHGAEIEASAWIMPGQPDGSVSISLGHGRKIGSVAALGEGYDAYPLRTSDAPWMADGVTVAKRDRKKRIITTQHHQRMEGRAIVRHATLEDFRADPHFVRKGVPPAPTESLYPDWPYDDEAWGMSIDQSACIGCMACVAACQAENNIPTVGPDEAERGHEMHWLRIDRYYSGSADDPDLFFQPVPCMHCEKAPCEIVCPVNATVHTHDGLNAQVYNRCIGTRYCSQNCPYKVRHFNFFAYNEFDKETAGPEQAVRNPDVSVRSRGVMEKCTYCVQRISEKRIHAQIENRAIEDGEVVTACQQACPTQAIVFGDIKRKDGKVAREKSAPQNYALLEELNTRPRTTYLGKISNPNAALVKGEGGDG
ncbi:MAG: TAT-variant-translocated molybdopterin oxidoreductase [Rhizobiaceae bacterium]